MQKLFFLLGCIFIFLSCNNDREIHLHFDDLDALMINEEDLPDLEIHKSVYVPAYSNLYYKTDVQKTYFTVTLSLRNISFVDSVFFDRIEFYDSEGKLLRSFIDKVLVLRPMESIEYIIESPDKKGGAGANFIVSYYARANINNLPYIEAIMLGNVSNFGFGFSSPGIEIND